MEACDHRWLVIKDMNLEACARCHVMRVPPALRGRMGRPAALEVSRMCLRAVRLAAAALMSMR